jgi:hypothetical protein
VTEFGRWCDTVTRQVRFRPDRGAIQWELTAHYQDHVRDLERVGYDWKLAEQRALAAMGDPEEIGRALDRVHKPWLGWLWMASRAVLALTVMACLLSLPGTGSFFHMMKNTLFPPEDPGGYQAIAGSYSALNEQEGVTVWRSMGTLEAQSADLPGYTLSLLEGQWWQYHDTFYRGECLLRLEPEHLWYDLPEDVLDDLVLTGSGGVLFSNIKYNPFPYEETNNWFSISESSNAFAISDDADSYRLEDSRDLGGWYLNLTMTTDEPVEWVELSFPYGDNHWAFRIMWEGAS